MKCPRCHSENPNEASFCGACGIRLAMACAACGAENRPANNFCLRCGTALPPGEAAFGPPATYTPQHLAAKILTSRGALAGERKQVTVLFADIKSSMELLAERDPEEARTILDPVLELMMEAVHRYEGTVNQVMGDGIMALFGAPLAHEDHAVRACYAALRMQEAVGQYAEALRRLHPLSVRVRVGLNSGEVVVRAIGNDLHMDYTAVGQTTHLAARMEQLAEPGHTLLTAGTFRLAEGYVEVDRRGLIPVKGLPGPVEIYELTAAGRARRRFEVTAVRGLSRFVGRAAELDRLQAALERAERGAGQVVAIPGEPGVGKSRLVHEFVHSPRTQGWTILETGAVSYHQATPYFSITSLLRGYFKIDSSDDTAVIREKVTGKLLTLKAEVEPGLGPLLALLDVPADDAAWAALDPPGRRRRTIEAVVQVVRLESSVRPLLLVFEDLHWADSETRAVLDALVESVLTMRVLLVVNYRPEFVHDWDIGSSYTQLAIEPLPPAQAGELLDGLLGEDPGLDEAKRLLIARTEGNPFFLEESVRALIETHVLHGEPGVYRAVAPLHGTAVPSTVQAVLAARIDRLSDEDRRLLQSAAVIGKDVPLALLDAIAGTPADALRRWLARLQSADFLYETRAFPDLEFTFKHALTHEVAYKTLLHDRRRILHARIAEAIETLYADRLGEHVERLAHHAVAGERWEMAVTYARQAGTKALARSAYREAVGHFEQAVAAIAHLPAARTTREAAVDLRFELRTALAPLGAHEQIAAHLGEAEKLATELGDDARRGRVSAYLADYFRQVGEHERAISAGERALAIARRLGDPTLEVASNTYLGQACQNTGQYRRAMTLFRRTAELAGGDLVGGTFGLPFVSSVQSRIWLASCLNELGEFATGIQVAKEAIRIAETANHAASLATACSVLGNLYLRRGEPADAVAVLERGYELSQAGDLHIWTPNAESWLGLAYVTLGRVDEGLRLLQSAVERERSMRRLAHHAVRLTALAEGLMRVGRGAEALGAVAQALALARNQGERGNEAHAHRAGGDIAAGAASNADAEAAYHHGLALADELEMRPVAARCHLGLARLWRASGRDADARLHRQRALALFEAMGARALAGQALAEQALAEQAPD